MLFKRKNSLSFWRNIKRYIWPESGFSRASKYLFYRLVRLPGSVHSIAAGVACGAAVSWTPLWGLHFIMAAAFAYIVRGNIIASAIGTVVGNPWTFPAICALNYKIGLEILSFYGMTNWPDFSMEAVLDAPVDFFMPLMVGGVPCGILVWFFVYGCMKLILTTHFEKVEARKKARIKLSIVKEPTDGP